MDEIIIRLFGILHFIIYSIPFFILFSAVAIGPMFPLLRIRKDRKSFIELLISSIVFLVFVIPNFFQGWIFEISLGLSITLIVLGGLALIQYIVFLILTLDKEHQELRRKENKLRREYRKLKVQEKIKMMEDYVNEHKEN